MSDRITGRDNGHAIYEYSLKNVPADEIKKVAVHHANEKIDDAYLARFMRLCRIDRSSAENMPMNFHGPGDSSAATIPTLYDMFFEGRVRNHDIRPGDAIMFASVGAGMNINSVVYRQWELYGRYFT